jgi:succinate dehydrogenase / fumarate reductase cytochrome b subunit
MSSIDSFLKLHNSAAARLQSLLAQTRGYRPKTAYRWHLGFIAWLLHRLTGLVLVFYLFLHLYVLHNLARGPGRFDWVMSLVQNPAARFLEWCLLAVVVYHSVNGLRIVFLDYGPLAGRENYVKWTLAAFAVTAALIILGGLGMIIRLAVH